MLSANIDTLTVPYAPKVALRYLDWPAPRSLLNRCVQPVLPLHLSQYDIPLRLHALYPSSKAQPTVTFFGGNIPRSRVEEAYRVMDESILLVHTGSSVQVLLCCRQRCCLVSSTACATVVAIVLLMLMLLFVVKLSVLKIPCADAGVAFHPRRHGR